MWDHIGELARPLMSALGDWSLRWALLIGLLAAWFALRPPRRAPVRHAMGLAVLLAGLLLPAVPRWGRGIVAEVPGAGAVAAPATGVAPEVVPISIDSVDVATGPSTIPTALDGEAPPAASAVADRRGWNWAWAGLLVAWLSGAAVFLARLVLGVCCGGQLRRGSIPASGHHLAQLDECRGSIRQGRRARLLLSPEVASPVVLVGHRGTILVPDDWDAWPAGDRRAALLHELAHLARWDDWQRLGQEIVRAAFWFHPGVHWLLGRIDREREMLCDEAVVRNGFSPAGLAEILLDACRRPWRSAPGAETCAVIPFFARKTTKQRILRLLGPDAESLLISPSPRVIGAIALVAGATLLGAGSVQVFAEAGSGPKPEGSQGASDPPRSPEDAAKAERKEKGFRQPSLLGRIVDEEGKPLPGAKVILYAGFATRWKIAEGTTDANGMYRIDDIQSSMIQGEKEDRWDYYVGVRVEHPTHVEADGRSWRDILIPSIPGHEEKLDFRLTKGGHIAGVLKDARTGRPLKDLDLRLLQPSDNRGNNVTFSSYAKTDDRGRFRSITLFPGEYRIDVNDSTMGFPLLGKVKVEPWMVTEVIFDGVTLPEVIEGRVLDADDKPIGNVDVTLLDPKDSDIVPRGKEDYSRVRTRAWTITRDDEGKFALGILPGLEQSRSVLAVHETLGWAKMPVEGIKKGEPIRLRPWPK